MCFFGENDCVGWFFWNLVFLNGILFGVIFVCEIIVFGILGDENFIGCIVV